MNILHICRLDKFIPPYIEFVRKNYLLENHFFFTRGHRANNQYVEDSFTRHYKNKLDLIFLLNKMKVSDKIILHGLFDVPILYLLFLHPYLLKKCHWVIWGADLYAYKSVGNSFRSRRHEYLRRFVIKRIGYLLTYIEGDIQVARKIYKAQGIHLETLAYLSNVVNIYPIEDFEKRDNNINILIGNSASSTNKHFEIIDILKDYKYGNIKVYAPLTYGDLQYGEKVVAYGKELLGEKFIPITQHVSISEYLNFLQKIDIAIFNHDRQKAMGNTINLIGMGKIVYLRENTAQWDFFTHRNMQVLNIDNFSLEARVDAHSNIKKVANYFSYETFYQQWSAIFDI